MRKLYVLLSAVLLVALLQTAAWAAPSTPFPSIIGLPDGFRPEGVAVGRGAELFVGSIPTGAILRIDLRTGSGSLLVPAQAGRAAIGLSLDQRSNHLFVAGGPTGAGFVYDAGSGASLATYALTAPGTFVNDVVVTRSAAYFTDSFRAVLYRVPLGPQGQLPAPAAVSEISLSGDFTLQPGFNLNGIDATPDGKALIVVQSSTGSLFHVDPASGVTTQIDLGSGSVPFGDGILLDGKTLYVVQNRLNQIAVIRLEPTLLAGEIVATLTDPALDVPTTVAGFGSALYTVNARFTTPPQADTAYDVVRLPKAQ